jgi:hypothetical protein
VTRAAARLKKPVLIVAPQTEKRQADEIFMSVASRERTLCLSPHNLHGSRTLFLAEYPQTAWESVRTFLGRYGKGPRSAAALAAAEAAKSAESPKAGSKGSANPKSKKNAKKND